MDQTRREFIKDIAITGAVVVTGTEVCVNTTAAGEREVAVKQTKCPFFDQPLMCEGPDEFGIYRCDT